MVTTRPPKTIVEPTALGTVANTDTKSLIYGLFQKGRVLAQDALEETKIIRQTVKYKGGEILNGQLKDGKVKYATIGSKFRPPNCEASMWLLARRFPERWGAQAKGEAHEGKAPDRQATVIFYKLDKNGRICDLVLPSDPHFK